MKLFFGDVIIIAVAILVFGLGSYWTRQGMAWYALLKRPAITPPGWVFSVAWTIIYICTAVCAALVWRMTLNNTLFYVLGSLFLINAIANVLWTYLFFVQHIAMWALVDALVLFATTWVLIGLLAPLCLACTGLLVPYGLWLCLALYLNWQIIVLNVGIFF